MKKKPAEGPTEEPTQEEMDEALEWLFEAARKDIIPKMRASKFCMTVVAPSDNIDPALCLQLGVALLLDLPLMIIGVDNAWIPARVRGLADVIVEIGSMTEPDAKERVHAAMKAMADRYKVKQA